MSAVQDGSAPSNLQIAGADASNNGNMDNIMEVDNAAPVVLSIEGDVPSKVPSWHQRRICQIMGSTYNPSSYLPTHSINNQTCIVLQQRYFLLLDDDDIQEISERDYNTRVGASFVLGGIESFDPSSIVIAHELVYDPKVITDNNVLVLDAFPIAVNLRQLKRNRDLERRVANRERRLANVSSGDDMSYSSDSDSEDSTMSHDLLRNDWKCGKGCDFTCENYKELKDHERICSAICRFQTIVRRRLVRKREEENVHHIFSSITEEFQARQIPRYMVPCTEDIRSMLCNLGDVSLVIDYYVNTYSYERVKIIIQLVEHEFAREHVRSSQGSPDKDWVLRVLSEVGGNEDVCIEECIRRMNENQQVNTSLFPFKDLYETEEIVGMYSDERVGAIRQLVVHEFAQNHLCGSQGIPKMSWVRRVLSEVGGNDDECVIECIDRMITLQEIEQEPDFLLEEEQKVRGIDDIITDIGRLAGSTEPNLDLAKELHDYISSHPLIIGDSRVALAVAILYKSFNSEVRELARPLLSKVPPGVLQEAHPLVAEIYSSLPTIESAIQVTESSRNGNICYSFSILGSHSSGAGSKETQIDLYLNGSRRKLRIWSPSKTLGESIKDRLNELNLIGKTGSISTSYTTKKSQVYALVDEIRGDRLCVEMILRASRDVSPMKCSDLGRGVLMPLADTVSGQGIPFLASLLISDDDVEADMCTAIRPTSTAAEYSVNISVAGATHAANNPHVKTCYISGRISATGGATKVNITCPTESLFAVVTNCAERVEESRELKFVKSNIEDAAKILLFILRQDPSVVEAVQQYLDTKGVYVAPNSKKDLLFGIGGKGCPNLAKVIRNCLEKSDLDMYEGDNAEVTAQSLFYEISQAGARVLVNTCRGFVVDDEATAIKRLASQLKKIQFYIQNQLEINESARARRRAKTLEDIEHDVKQLKVLHEAALKRKEFIKKTVYDIVLTSSFTGHKDATPFLKDGRFVFHFTAKNTSDQKSWYYNSDGEPVLASNATLQANRPTAHAGFHKPRNPKDRANWGTIDNGKGLRHLTTHHGYRGRKEFNLLIFTSANKLYPGWNQFKVKTGINGRSGETIFPNCALYTQCFVDPVPCLIVNLKLASDVVDENTKMTVTWMNGKRVKIDARDERFNITSSGAITHPEAQLYSDE